MLTSELADLPIADLRIYAADAIRAHAPHGNVLIDVLADPRTSKVAVIGRREDDNGRLIDNWSVWTLVVDQATRVPWTTCALEHGRYGLPRLVEAAQAAENKIR